MLPLGDIFSRATGGSGSSVDVLKIDCEGCEWGALAKLAKDAPWLLSRVRILHLELHLTPALGLTNATQQLGALLSFLIELHGFRIFRRKFNAGWAADKKQMHPELVANGLLALPCCVELSLVRPSDLDATGRCAFEAPGGANGIGNSLAWSANPLAILPAPFMPRGVLAIKDDALFKNPRLESKSQKKHASTMATRRS